MQQDDQELVLCKIESAVAELKLNRPVALNALNQDLLQALLVKLGEVTHNGVRAVIITGAGDKSFVAGADIQCMSQLEARPIAEFLELGQRVMRAIECTPMPVIAAVNGYALGGGLELALACDFILASEKAKFGAPEVTLGIIPGFGGTQRLIQRCGIGTARYLSYTGEVVRAEEALRLGIVDKMYAPDQLLAEAHAFALRLANAAPLAVQATKRVIRESQEPQLLNGLRREVEGFLTVFASKDRAEGMSAFLEKRAAKFEGK